MKSFLSALFIFLLCLILTLDIFFFFLFSCLYRWQKHGVQRSQDQSRPWAELRVLPGGMRVCPLLAEEKGKTKEVDKGLKVGPLAPVMLYSNPVIWQKGQRSSRNCCGVEGEIFRFALNIKGQSSLFLLDSSFPALYFNSL